MGLPRLQKMISRLFYTYKICTTTYNGGTVCDKVVELYGNKFFHTVAATTIH